MEILRRVYVLLRAGSFVEEILKGQDWPNGQLTATEGLAIKEIFGTLIDLMVHDFRVGAIDYLITAEFLKSRQVLGYTLSYLFLRGVPYGPINAKDRFCATPEERPRWKALLQKHKLGIKIAIRAEGLRARQKAVNTAFKELLDLFVARVVGELEGVWFGPHDRPGIQSVPGVQPGSQTVLVVLPDPFCAYLAEWLAKTGSGDGEGWQVRVKGSPDQSFWIVETKRPA